MPRFDIIMSWKETRATVRLMGWEFLLLQLRDEFPESDLYKVSQDWIDSPAYALKAKGTAGDVLIGWEENQGVKVI